MNKLQKDLAILNALFGLALTTLTVVSVLVVAQLVRTDYKVVITPKEAPVKEQIEEIPQESSAKRFTQEYRGSRIDKEYFTLLDKYCSDEALRTVIAISVAETGMGRDTRNNSNFYGWYKNGNKNYDPDRETMAKEICSGIERNYLGIGNDMNKVKRYVGSINEVWLYNYRWAYNKIK